MNAHPGSFLAGRRRLASALGIAAAVVLAGCTQGDFGRMRPSLVRDDMHDWVGRKAAHKDGRRSSVTHLTDDERQLRDLAYPLIAPSYTRGRWDSVLLEYGITRSKHVNWPTDDYRAYGKRLMVRPYRSAAARYSQLIDDMRNDITRIVPFFTVARRVLDIDAKRAKSMAYIADLTARERAEAERRIAENALIVGWVQHSLKGRADAFRYALERIVVATPYPKAVDAERTLMQLKQRISANRVVV